MENEKVYIAYHTFQDLQSGMNPLAITTIIEEITEGKIYILERDGANFLITLDEHDILQIGDQILGHRSA